MEYDVDLNKTVESCGKDIVIVDINFYNEMAKANCLYSFTLDYTKRKLIELINKSDRKLKREIIRDLSDIVREIERR